MGDLSKNFDEREFACRHCYEVKVDPRLVKALQKLRDLAGKPVHVISGYRCEVNNRRCGGTRYSQHLRGRAADIFIEGMGVDQMLKLAEQIPAFRGGGMGRYPNDGFIHIDVRKKKARW